MAFFIVTSDILRNSSMSITDKAVLFYLASCADENKACSPPYKRIAFDLGICKRTAIRAVKRLEELKYIGVQKRRRVDNGFSSNLYIINSPI